MVNDWFSAYIEKDYGGAYYSEYDRIHCIHIAIRAWLSEIRESIPYDYNTVNNLSDLMDEYMNCLASAKNLEHAARGMRGSSEGVLSNLVHYYDSIRAKRIQENKDKARTQADKLKEMPLVDHFTDLN